VWNVLSAQDKSCAVIGVPMAYPVEEINGMMVGGFMTPSTNVPFTYPVDLQSTLVEKGYTPSMGYKDAGADKNAFLDRLVHTASIKYEETLKWLRNENWDCFITVLSEPDWVQHYLDRPEGDPMHEENEAAILRFFSLMDEYVGSFVQAAGPSAYVLVCSDHGFGHFVHRNVHVNSFLADQGYLTLKPSASASIRGSILSRIRNLARFPGWRFIRDRIPGKLKSGVLDAVTGEKDCVDWEETKAYFRHSSWIMGAVEFNRKAFSSKSSFQLARSNLLRELRELRDSRENRRVFREVHLREDVFVGPFAHRAPDIVCLFEEGYGGNDLTVAELFADIPLAGVPRASHRQNGVWLLSGPHIQAGLDVVLRLQDIAPLVYHLLNAKPQAGMDGEVPREIFEPGSFLHSRKCLEEDFSSRKRSYILPTEEEDAQSDSLVVDRLRSLGYLE
jgi:predicted AlkP superfamily phosphohydrolase/phosphomutase